MTLNMHSQAPDSLRIELDRCLKLNDTINTLMTSRILFRELRKESRYFEALQLFKEMIKLTSTPKDRFFFLNSIGQIYIDLTDYDSAMVQYNQLLKESEIANNKRYHGFALNNIGYIYYQNDQYEKALVYHKRALAIRMEDNDEKRIGSSYNNIGLMYFHMDSLVKAYGYYSRAREMFQKANHQIGEANTLNNIGNVYIEQEIYDQALDYHNQALEIRVINNDIRGTAESYKNLSRIYTVTGKYHEAEQLIKKGISVAEEIGSSHLLKAFYLESYKLSREKGDHQKALEQYMLYSEFKDSLISLESRNRIAELEIQYETEKREQQIGLLDIENKRKQEKLNSHAILLIISGVVILLIILIFILFVRQSKLKSQLKVEEGKQRLFRSQMNPHFIYNALSAIQNFILQNDPMDSIGYISEFSGLMRLVLEGSRSEMVPLSADIELAETYLKLQKLRFNSSFNYSIEIINEVPADLIHIPPMLSQPFIENAVEHGMRKMPKGRGYINVLYSLSNDTLQVEIVDNGPGISSTEKKETKHHSLATKITRERIENIRKTLGIMISMSVSNVDGKGTKVVFLIPQKQDRP